MADGPTYVKRYRMELPLRDLPPVPELPGGFAWLCGGTGLGPAFRDGEWGPWPCLPTAGASLPWWRCRP